MFNDSIWFLVGLCDDLCCLFLFNCLWLLLRTVICWLVFSRLCFPRCLVVTFCLICRLLVIRAEVCCCMRLVVLGIGCYTWVSGHVLLIWTFEYLVCFCLYLVDCFASGWLFCGFYGWFKLILVSIVVGVLGVFCFAFGLFALFVWFNSSGFY